MIEVRIGNKEAKHSVNVEGKFINFENGSAMVTEKQAQIIKGWNDPEYKVIEPEIPKEQPRKKSRGKSAKKKE